MPASPTRSWPMSGAPMTRPAIPTKANVLMIVERRRETECQKTESSRTEWSSLWDSSGISAAVAQTVIELGIEVGEVETRATLRDALEEAFRRVGIEVRRVGT